MMKWALMPALVAIAACASSGGTDDVGSEACEEESGCDQAGGSQAGAGQVGGSQAGGSQAGGQGASGGGDGGRGGQGQGGANAQQGGVGGTNAGGSGAGGGGSSGGVAGGGGAAGGNAGNGGTGAVGGGGTGGSGGRPGPAGAWKLVFVGNSFTFNSGIAGHTKDMVTQGQSDVVISTANIAVNWNRGLYYHWNIGTTIDNKKTLEIIRSRAYTHVVLQDFMLHPTDKAMPNMTTGEGSYGVEIARDYGKRFIDEIKANAQVPVVWSIWPEKAGQADFEALILAYKKIAEDNGAVFVPASAAWFLALKERPNLAFWASDNFHPSSLGGYACACVFYAVLTGKSPVGNPYMLKDYDAGTQKFIQEKAWQAYLTYGTKTN